jgi:gamma-glutamyltranspeptidase
VRQDRSEPRVDAERHRQLRGGTVYLTTADRWGNRVSFIYSGSGSGSGSGVTVPGYGFLPQKRGALFTLEPANPTSSHRARGRSTRSSRRS